MSARLASRLRRAARATVPPLLAGLAVASGTTPPGSASTPPGAPRVGAARATAASAHSIAPPERLPDVRAVATVVTPRRVLLGAWVKPRGNQSHQQAVAGLEAAAGRRFSVDHVYHGWDDPLIGSYERWSAARGHTLLINWKAVHETADGTSNGSAGGYVRWADIAAGKEDATILVKAAELKRFGRTVYLNFHHEPEDDRDLPGWRRAGDPADYRAAWKHIRAVFARAHATNVRFVCILMGWSFRRGEAAQWYPGDGVVDAVGADAYNWFGTAHPGSGAWITFDAAFGAAYRFARSHGKPLWVAETGVQEDPAHPSRKAAWYRSVAAQAQNWPDLQAVVFFMGGRFGWYPDSSAPSMAAFRALARSRPFR